MPKQIEKQVFSLIAPETFSATVQIPRPGNESAHLRLIFRHKSREQLNEWLESGSDAKSDAQWISAIVDGWEDVDAEFSVEALERLFNNYHNRAVNAIVGKYLDELREARQGN